MPKDYIPVEIRPDRGGRLITRGSLENVGLFDYSVKREVRRDLDIEVQREGHDYFWPSVDDELIPDPGNQPFPLEEDDPGPINLTHEVVRENGHRAVIVGTPTRLYRFNTMDRGGVYEEDVFEDGIYEDSAADWLVIGRGFSEEGHRWEAQRIRGYLWLNNGRDLPVTYRVQDSEVKPVYELREQGISHVGTIAEVSGVPVCMDISQIPEDLLPELFTHNGIRLSGGIYAQASGTTVEATEAFFTDDDVGRRIVFDDGTSALITGVLTPESVSVDETIEAHPQPFRLRTLLSQAGSLWSGVVTADQAAGSATVTASDNIFTAEMVGSLIRFVNGWTTEIVGYTSATSITTADEAPDDFEDYPFWVISDDIDVGWSDVYLPNPDTGLIHKLTVRGAEGAEYTTWGVGEVGAASDLVLYNSNTNETHAMRLRGPAGEEWFEYDAGIPLVGDPPIVYAENTDTGLGHSLAFRNGTIKIGSSVTGGGDYIVVASAPLFTADHVGRTLHWDTGDSRRIVAYLSSTQVVVDSDLTHAEELGAIENLDTYERWDGAVDRVTYRCLWGSKPDNPRRWGVIGNASAVIGESRVSLKYPFKSFASEQEITLVGAGAEGGNLTTEVLFATDNQVLLTADQVETSVTDGLIQQSDVIGSIVGFEDLEHNGSAILRGLSLKGRLVVYKDSCMFIGTYTGNPDQPFVFERKEVPSGKTLYYRWSLVGVNDEYHLFVGKGSIYKFDLVSMVPREFESAELCKNVIFGQATIANTNSIFAATNELTNEVWFWFPSAATDKALVFDYMYGTWSTSARAMTAAATVRRPAEGGIVTGESEHWFLMAANNVLVVYGLSTEDVESWGGAKSISYMRSAKPFTLVKSTYDWALRGGLSDFGARHGEKDIRSYVLHLASTSGNIPVNFELLGARNAAESVVTLAQVTIASPAEEPLISAFFRRHYFGWSLSGTSDPSAVIQIAGQTFEVSGVNSRSFVRRVA